MCDTMVALPNVTAHSVSLFAKNSDRERSEPQGVEIIPAQRHGPRKTVQCTYISIPQAPQTHRVLLCRPCWMWGAEMGANEFGVAIGNEAVFARSPDPTERALIGMDLVRLGLERGRRAAEALGVMIDLLERHGQGGNCGLVSTMYYQNSFIIADPTEAFVFETIDRDWIVQKVDATRAISNIYTIGKVPFRKSAGLDARIRANRWSSDDEIDYRTALANPDRSMTSGLTRYGRSCARLAQMKHKLTADDLMAILRDHGPDRATQFTFRPPRTKQFTVCAHASDEEPRGQTVGSLISELYADSAVHWVTAGSSACASIFKPVCLDLELPVSGLSQVCLPDQSTVWWRHEALTNALFQSPDETLTAFRTERDTLEESFRDRVRAVRRHAPSSRGLVIAACWTEAMAFEDRWAATLKD